MVDLDSTAGGNLARSSDISDKCLSEMSDAERGDGRSNQTKTVQNLSQTGKYAELYVRYRHKDAATGPPSDISPCACEV